MVGDDDAVVLEHAIAPCRALPHGELAVVPATSHGLLVEKPELCNRMIVDFLTTDPVETFAPHPSSRQLIADDTRLEEARVLPGAAVLRRRRCRQRDSAPRRPAA
ncbi:MAG TPA: hypothetical protein VEZ46_15535, partial [Mycobacteriales bacterium]|nr:hypothetical protein [Mycobacteriales bacterium]